MRWLNSQDRWRTAIEAKIDHYHFISRSVESNSYIAQSNEENVYYFIMKCVLLSLFSVLLPMFLTTYGNPSPFDNIKIVNEKEQLINLEGEVVIPSK